MNYDKAWSDVQTAENKGLPQSALTVVQDIYQKAKAENNAVQLVKAVIYKLKFTDYKEENGLVKSLNALRDEANTAVFPAKPILHSMLAEMYWQYYQNNRYRFMHRTQTVNANEDDIETWSLDKIVAETQHHYRLSIVDAEKAQASPIALYIPILNEGNELGRAYRPTLFDFLAWRAIDFFVGQEATITQPAERFELTDDRYLADANTFINLTLTSTDTLSMKFHALVLWQQVLRFHQRDTQREALVEADLARLKFVRRHHTSPIKNQLYLKTLDLLQEQLKGTPLVTLIMYERAQVYVETAALYKPLQSEDHKWDKRTAMSIAEEAVRLFPNSPGALQCATLQHSLRDKSFNIEIEATNLPGQAFRALLSYRNLTALHYRAVRITRDEIQELKKKHRNLFGEHEDKLLQYFAARPTAASGKFDLIDDLDYQQHSTEVKIEALPAGEYIVIVSHAPDFKTEKNGQAYAFTTVSNIAYLHRSQSDGTTEFYVRHRATGEPLANVKADLYTRQYNDKKQQYEKVKLATYTTDANGYFKAAYVNKDYRNEFVVNFAWNQDQLWTESINFYDDYYYGDGSIYQHRYDNRREATHITHFFLDRAIYRPGQTLYFKGLVTRFDGKKSEIIPKHKATIRLYDVNSQPKGEVEVTTNEYGTFQGTFVTPSSGLMGEMHLTNEDGSGSVSFSVEEYKRPKFEVGFEPVKATFSLNQSIQVEGYARAYSGANIDGAQVQYRVVREARFPFWWWCRWGYYPSSPAMEIAHGNTVTDVQGRFKVDFKAIPDVSVAEDSDPTFSYTVYADVTDINGETHSESYSVNVGYKSLLVGVQIPNLDKGEPDKLKTEFPIIATNLAGSPISAEGEITIYALKSPDKAFRERLWERPDRQIYSREVFYGYFPVDLYADENNKYTWERSKRVFSARFNTTTARSFTVADLKQWKEGEYLVEITSKDEQGKPVKEISYFTVMNTQGKHLASPVVDLFKPLKSTAEPGEKAVLLVGTQAGKIHVLYEVERDGVILSKEWLTLHNEQRRIEIPIQEEYRGNIGIHYTFIKDNRRYKHDDVIIVPYTNKTLDISFRTFRDKLQPGQQERWEVLVKGHRAEAVAAEMVATLYDASLDVFRTHGWSAGFFESYYTTLSWESVNDYKTRDFRYYYKDWNPYSHPYILAPSYDALNWFGYSFYRYYDDMRRRAMPAPSMMRKADAESDKMEEGVAMSAMADSAVAVAGAPREESKKQEPQAPANDKSKKEEESGAVKIRTNFNETAFFFPNLYTNDKGEITISFTVPDALTRWKMLGFAHTKDLQSGLVTKQLVTQKELMVVPNAPRFFREHDKMIFSTKITSLADQILQGEAHLELFDALTMKPVDAALKNIKMAQNFTVAARQSTVVQWAIEIPEGLQAITYRVVAKAGAFADGEEMTVPVVTNRMLVTESLPLPIRGGQSKTFRFDKLVDQKSTTLKHYKYTLEFTSNPAWYAVQALPYLMEYPYECVEQTFSRYYANAIASHIANSHPRIRQVFDTWRNIQPDALLSNLEKNQELKSALLEETPWVLEAKDEGQRKRAVGLLFDLNRMANEQERALKKVLNAQTGNGGFTWFPGFPEDRYMTQHIIAGIGHLNVMGIPTQEQDGMDNMLANALDYLDREMRKSYDELKEQARRKYIVLEEYQPGYLEVHALYTRSYFMDRPISAQNKEAFDFYRKQSKKYWLKYNLYTQGMLCLALHRFNDKALVKDMIKSFNERALHSEEMGMYWKSENGYFWYQAPIERQALMIELYEDVAQDKKSVEALKVWLLKQKQTQDWKTTKATTEACYALLRRGTDLLLSHQPVAIRVGQQDINATTRPDIQAEAGTGYFKTSWTAPEITSDMGNIKVSKTDEGVAWGAVYWQYFEQLDKITAAETPLRLKKELFLQQNSDRGPVITPITTQTTVKVGDLIKVRIELRVDRDMEYVHLKDMRAAAFEPTATLSQYKYQDGIYYYESPRDLATNFFIGYLRKGTYVFEYELRASQQGDFSNGITTIQSMYAPEFTSHSQGVRVNIK